MIIQGGNAVKKYNFDEFISVYDGETKGKYAYYYKYLWNACHYAEAYQGHKANWMMKFKTYLEDHAVPVELNQSVTERLGSWLED